MATKQSSSTAFAEAFIGLRRLLAAYEAYLVVVTDGPDEYYLDTPYIMKNKKPLFFGAVWIKKAYVSYHLFPVYMYPELLAGISPALRMRMQGKSCFNFKTLESSLLTELGDLTEIGFERIKAEGFLDGV